MDKLSFNKLILGDFELDEFEHLLVKDRYGIEGTERYDSLPFKNKRITNRSRLLVSLLLYEKIDAVTLSSLDLSPLIDAGVVEPESCIVAGTHRNHPLEEMLNAAWKLKQNIISALYVVLDDLLNYFNLKHEIYPRNVFHDEDLLELVDSILYEEKHDFVAVLKNLVRKMFDPHEMMLSEDIIIRAQELIDQKEELLFSQFSKVKESNSLFRMYCDVFSRMQESSQWYSVPNNCRICEKEWGNCVSNSEFFSQCNFLCPQREDLGAQKFAKMNGLVTSHLQNATLFDNSIRFKTRRVPLEKITEDIYHIVNIDMSQIIGSLPVPHTVQEAMRLRERPEIKSYRNIFLSWCENMYRGDVPEAEYIKRDFDDANKFFKDKERSEKCCPAFRCTCEIIGNQIPYLSNIIGIVSPLQNLHNRKLEEKYRWILLTR